MKEKFSAQADSEVLAAMREIAENQGRQLPDILEQAMRDYVDRYTKVRHRRKVVESFADSVREYDGLYRELAK